MKISRRIDPNQPTREATKKDFYAFINQMLAAIFIINTCDEMQGSNLYRHELKAKGTVWIKEISRLVDNFSKIGDADVEFFFGAQDHFNELFNEMASLRPEQLIGLKEIVKLFKENPEEVLQKFDIKIIEREPVNA